MIVLGIPEETLVGIYGGIPDGISKIFPGEIPRGISNTIFEVIFRINLWMIIRRNL